MEKAKSKKKLIAIIAGAAMAFVLTVVVSVAATLAYFGATDNANDTITMGEALNFTSAGVTATASVKNVLPGSTGNLTINATIDKTTTEAYVRLKVETSGQNANILTVANSIEVAGLGTFVKAGEDGYHYLANTTTTANMQVVDASATGGKAITVVLPYSVAANVTSTTEGVTPGGTLTVTATMEIIQAENIGDTSVTEGVVNAGTVASVAAAWETDGIVVG